MKTSTANKTDLQDKSDHTAPPKMATTRAASGLKHHSKSNIVMATTQANMRLNLHETVQGPHPPPQNNNSESPNAPQKQNGQDRGNVWPKLECSEIHAVTSRDFLHKRLQRAFTRANQLH